LPWLFAKALMLAVKPVDPACFSEPPDRCAKPVLRPPVPSPHSGNFRARLSTPQRLLPTRHARRFLGPFSARFWRPTAIRILGRRARHPLPRPAGGMSVLEPFGSDRRGLQTHSRRTVQS